MYSAKRQAQVEDKGVLMQRCVACVIRLDMLPMLQIPPSTGLKDAFGVFEML